MIEQLPARGDVLGFTFSGKLHTADFEHFVPAVDAAIASYGKVRVLGLFRDFEGWSSGGLVEELKFDVAHASKFERIALVGEKSWHEWMATLSKPFTSATVRYFDTSELDAAWAWLQEP